MQQPSVDALQESVRHPHSLMESAPRRIKSSTDVLPPSSASLRTDQLEFPAVGCQCQQSEQSSHLRLIEFYFKFPDC